MHGFSHPASRRRGYGFVPVYGAAISEAEKATYRKDVQSGKTVPQKVGTRTAAIAESIRTGVPIDPSLVIGGEVTEAEPAEEVDAMTVGADADVAPPSAGVPLWVWLTGGTVLLAGTGFAIYYFTRKKKGAEAETDTSAVAA